MAEYEGWNDLLITVKEHNGRINISDWEDNLWMLISSNDNNVELKIYPQEIPVSYIGRAAKEFDELKYNISCKSAAEAVNCKRFLADFMDCGYGQRIFSGKKGWLAPLDIEDMTKIFSTTNTFYREIILNTPDTPDDIALLFRDEISKEADNLFVSIYTKSLDHANLVMDSFYSGAPEGCMVWCQFLFNDDAENENVAHVFYN